MKKSTITKAVRIVIPFCLFAVLGACVPQVELVNLQTEMAAIREETRVTKARVQSLQRQLNQGPQGSDANAPATGSDEGVQQAMADFGARFDQISTDIQLIQGKLEENNFRIDETDQKIDDKTVRIAELSERIDDLEAEIKKSGAVPGQAMTNAGKAKKSSTRTVEPSEAYRQAKSDFDKGNFDLALAGFQNFVIQFPETSLASSAQYWIGECYYAKRDFNKAIESFQKVVDVYPKSRKVPGAKIKIGLSYWSQNDTVKAREYLNKVINEYPGTTEAAIARDRLQKIPQ